MADNITVLNSSGSAETIAYKEIASVKHQKAILTDEFGNAVKVTNNALDVSIQDQHTRIVNLSMHVDGTTSYLRLDANIDKYTIGVQVGHGATTGSLVYLEEGSKYYEGVCVSSTSDTITLDTPLDNDFASGVCLVNVGDKNLNKNGSVTRVIAHIKAPVGVSWDITRMMFYIEDNAVMDDSKFGAVSRLSKGVVLRKKNGDYQNIFNVKSNGDFALQSFDATYTTAAPSGNYGFRCRRSFAGSEKNGVTIRLEPGDELEILIQDDLSGLVYFYAVAQGHVVE